MFTLFEGWFWCFFLEKKDILRDLEPKSGGMVDGGEGYGGGLGPYYRLRWLLSGGKRVGHERTMGELEKSLNSPGRVRPADTEVDFCWIYRCRDGGWIERKRKQAGIPRDGEGRRGRTDNKAPARSICAKALMGVRPERWTSTISERRLVTLQIPANNLPFLLARVLPLSVGHNPLFGRKQSVAACRHLHHPSPSPFQPDNSPSNVHIKIFVLK